MEIRLKVNGEWKTIDVSSKETLLQVLREKLHLMGTKEGCGKGECGACTVILDGRPVPSCIVIAATIDGSGVVTVEGLTPNEGLNPIQNGLIEAGGVQCGFCTPGFVVSGTDFFKKRDKFTISELKRALSGNLCRCTGYKKILDGMLIAAKKMGKEIKDE